MYGVFVYERLISGGLCVLLVCVVFVIYSGYVVYDVCYAYVVWCVCCVCVEYAVCGA